MRGSTVYGPKDVILSITTGSSIRAITLTAPPHSDQVSMSIINTPFNRQAQVIAVRRSAGDWHCLSASAFCLLPLPGLDGVTGSQLNLFAIA